MNPFDVNRKTRENILSIVDALSTEQLNKIPEGYSNNIVWQLGHVLATQQLLVYGLSNSEILLSDNIINEFRKGTKPEQLYSTEDIKELKAILVEVIDRTEEDYNLEVMQSYKEYPTSYGVTLSSVEDAIEFNNVHEGLHLGVIMAMRKLV